MHLAMESTERGDWSQAESLFENAVKICPEDERAREQYAEALWRRGAGDSALVQMQEAARLSEGDPRLQVRLGEMYLATGDLDSAAQRADRAIARQPKLSTGWALSADVARRRGDVHEALHHYHRAISLQPNYPRVQRAVAWLYFTQNRPQRALSTLQGIRDVGVSGRRPLDVIYLEGMVLKSLGRHDDAVDRLTECVGRGGATADAFFELAEAAWLSGELLQARWATTEALRLQPQDQRSLQMLAQIEAARQEMATAARRRPAPNSW